MSQWSTIPQATIRPWHNHTSSFARVLLTSLCGLLYCVLVLGSNRARADEKAKPKKEVTIETKSYDEAMETLKGLKGKVVVMDCWSTSCAPCKKEFHHLVELSEKHSADKVQCVSLNFDFIGVDPIEESIPKIKKFLVEQKAANVLNIVSTDEDSLLYEKLQFPAIPAVFVYDQEGKLVKRFDNSDPKEKKFTYEDVQKMVTDLLKSKAKTGG